MKRFLSVLLALCMVMTILPVAALAAGTEVASGTCGDNLTWKLDSEGTLTVSGTGAMDDYPGGQLEQPWGDYSSQIIKVVVEPGVTTIGTRAFSYCFALESVSLPNGLTSIGGYAFAQCSALAQINLPESLTELGTEVFDACTALTSIVIPGSVKTIEPFTFEFCSSLTSVTMGEGTTTIGTAAFENCHALTDVTIPSTVTSIGDSAFYSCRSLAQITIPSSVTSLGRMAFGTYYSDSVAIEITFEGDAPKMIPTEGSWFGTFQNVTATAYYPAGNPTWTEEVLTVDYGGTLTWVAYTSGETEKTEVASGTCGDNLTWTLDSEGTLTISGTGVMEDYSANSMPWADYRDSRDNVYIQKIVLEPGVTDIGKYAFSLCVNVTEVQLPETLVSIGMAAFQRLDSLETITLPESLQTIGDHTFFTSGLTSVHIPANVSTVYDTSFFNCSNLTTITVDEDNQDYVSVDNVLFDIDMTYLLHAAVSLEGQYIIPDTVTSVGVGAFSGCSQLTEVAIPEHITYLGMMAFQDCTALEEIAIPSALTSIDECVFSGCTGLTSLTIPASIKKIGVSAFEYCGSLKKIIFEGDAPTINYIKRFGIFCDVTATAYYPAGNATWTADVMQDYDGNITWVPYTPGEELPGEEVAGDLDGDGVVSDADVAELLWYVLFPTTDMDQNAADVDGDEDVDLDDVIYLLWYTLFPDDYPLQ